MDALLPLGHFAPDALSPRLPRLPQAYLQSTGCVGEKDDLAGADLAFAAIEKPDDVAAMHDP
jgi:hypothetical protein